MSYKITAEFPDGSVGMSEEFKYLRFALKAAKTALKAGMVVTITKQEKQG